jgi:sec-independent protein translocase protein TatA
MPFNLGVPELIIILVVVLVIFGPGKLPSIGASLGKGIREFKKATSEDEEKPAPAPVAPPPVAIAPPVVATTITPPEPVVTAAPVAPVPSADEKKPAS